MEPGERCLFVHLLFMRQFRGGRLFPYELVLCMVTMPRDKIARMRIFVNGRLVIYHPIRAGFVEGVESPANELMYVAWDFSKGAEQQCGVQIRTRDAAIGRKLKALFVKVFREAPPADNIAAQVAQILAY